MENFTRTVNLIGKNNFAKLQNSKVIVFGVGGVGGYVCEGLARCGVGQIDIVDFDTVSQSNINRQIIATHQTINRFKVDVMKQRILSINPNANINVYKIKVDQTNIDSFNFQNYDFVIDCIDMIISKVLIIKQAKNSNTNIISCMGTGNKLDATKLKIEDISKTTMCPLAKVMRKLLKEQNITKVPVLYSTEQPQKAQSDGKRKVAPNSIVFVPSVAGLLISQYVAYKLMEN